jgi:hypothetical protein
MTPAVGPSWGEVLIRVSRDFVLLNYIELRGQPHLEPRNFHAWKLKKDLPAHVSATIPEYLDTAYWKVDVQKGQITWITEITEREWYAVGDIFDEDREVRYDELADQLIEKCELDLRKPDDHKFNGLTPEQWDEVKTLAHERINGRA